MRLLLRPLLESYLPLVGRDLHRLMLARLPMLVVLTAGVHHRTGENHVSAHHDGSLRRWSRRRGGRRRRSGRIAAIAGWDMMIQRQLTEWIKVRVVVADHGLGIYNMFPPHSMPSVNSPSLSIQGCPTAPTRKNSPLALNVEVPHIFQDLPIYRYYGMGWSTESYRFTSSRNTRFNKSVNVNFYFGSNFGIHSDSVVDRLF